MKNIISVNINEIFIDLIVFIMIAVVSIICKAELLLVTMLMIWTACFIHAIFNIGKNIALLFFLISVFVFLLGREICFTYFGLERYYRNLEKYNETSFLLIAICLVFTMIGCHMVRDRAIYDPNNIIAKENFENSRSLCQRICHTVFVICYVCSIIVVIIQIIEVRSGGYLSTYLESSGDIAPAFLRYIASFMGTSACLFLATKPKKYVITLILYEIYALLTLFTGHRYTFIAISMTIVLYIYIRNRIENKKIPRKYIALVVILMPLLLLGMNYINAKRVNENYTFSNISEGFVDFFDQQGGSINVIKRVGYYADDISDMKFVSFGNVKNTLFDNMVVRKLFGITSYSGNSVEHALKGNSLSHRLSYYEYGDYYLLGHGTGSSYIAELYHDFSIIGVVLGSLLYGVLLRKISMINFDDYFRDGLLLASFYYLILAPRDSFDNIVGGIFNVFSILGLILIWSVTNQLGIKKGHGRLTT